MIFRLGALLLLLVAGTPYGRAEPPTDSTTFNASLATSVYAAALEFIVPRALDAVTVPELTLWGLQGLAALDPDLSTTLGPNQLTLSYRQKPVFSIQVPRPGPCRRVGSYRSRHDYRGMAVFGRGAAGRHARDHHDILRRDVRASRSLLTLRLACRRSAGRGAAPRQCRAWLGIATAGPDRARGSGANG